MSPPPRSPIARRSTTAVALGAVGLLAALAVQGPAEATVAKVARPAPDVVMNTIDPVVTRDRTRFADGGARVHASALGGRHRWSAPVEVLTSGFDG